MKRLIVALTSAMFAAVAFTPGASAFSPETAAASHAISYLHSLQGADGTVANDASRTEETVWGLAANNASIPNFATANRTTVDSLSSHIASEEKTAGGIGSLILAVSAAGLSPTVFAGHNLLQDLVCTYDATTGAFNDQIYNDALAVLSIPAGKAPTKSADYLASHQQADGGWEFSAGFGSDTNTTALVLMALKSGGALTETVKAKALLYLKSQQRVDTGGFQYQTGAFTTDSDPDSDGLVIEALLAAGEDPAGTGWSINQQNGLTDLLSFQYENGGFGYSRPGSSATAAPDPLSTTQPLVGLASTFLPVKPVTGTLPTACPIAAVTATPTPPALPPAATTTARLAQTGKPPFAPMVAGLIGMLLMAIGLRVRRRAR